MADSTYTDTGAWAPWLAVVGAALGVAGVVLREHDKKHPQGNPARFDALSHVVDAESGLEIAQRIADRYGVKFRETMGDSYQYETYFEGPKFTGNDAGALARELACAGFDAVSDGSDAGGTVGLAIPGALGKDDLLRVADRLAQDYGVHFEQVFSDWGEYVSHTDLDRRRAKELVEELRSKGFRARKTGEHDKYWVHMDIPVGTKKLAQRMFRMLNAPGVPDFPASQFESAAKAAKLHGFSAKAIEHVQLGQSITYRSAETGKLYTLLRVR